MKMGTPAPKQNETLATSWPLGCLTAMVKWSRLASHTPTQKVKPGGEASEFPVLENEEGNQAIYWNPPPFPGPSPQPFLESLQCAGCSPGGWGCRESLLPLERDSVPLLARQDMTRLPKPRRSSPKGCLLSNLLHPHWLSPSCGLPSQVPPQRFAAPNLPPPIGEHKKAPGTAPAPVPVPQFPHLVGPRDFPMGGGLLQVVL
ncbi:uncharacterized protein LOC115599715 isoform X1 [Calypte anna]|uniref:uncharacterized protein LOC115599715 isoform X1 n=1 Tax=Calypte anna TaxID=9244 RepID=UPI0011C3A8E5|nr:uncharacterized protein LOC115599715 isoform X1 [Calypte anna]